MGKAGWDLTSTHSLEGAAEWLRKRSDALLVLVIRGQHHGDCVADVAFATDPTLRPEEVLDMVDAAMPELVESMTKLRAEKVRKSS